MERINITCPHCSNQIEITEAVKKEVLKEYSTDCNEAINAEISRLKTELHHSHEREMDLLNKEKLIQEKVDNFELEVARQVSSQATEIRENANQKIRLSDQGNKILIDSLSKQIEDLQKKVNQGSQQTQGEILEIELTEVLKSKFPYDSIQEIGKGIKGGDVLQIVHNPIGEQIGSILWETKDTKSFSAKWIQKLKSDLLDAKADIGVILSSILPEEINHIGEVDGIWITDYSSLVGLATALRGQLLAISTQKKIERGKGDKATLLYDYLTSNEFKQRMGQIVEPFIEMQHGIAQEKRAMSKIWKVREKQVEQVIENLSMMSGDLQGITGKNLELPAFEMDNGER
jgi:hypothetical protein